MNQTDKIYIHGIDFNEYLSHSIVNSICVDSWYDNIPNATIKIWTEEDEDVKQWVKTSKWCQIVIERKNWAKLFEYIKNRILYKYGGIVLETDQYIFSDITKYGDNCSKDWAFINDMYCSWAPSYYKPGNEDFIKICNGYDSIKNEEDYYKYMNESYLGKVSLYRNKPIAIRETNVLNDFFHFYYSDVYKNRYWHHELASICFDFSSESFTIIMSIKNVYNDNKILSISNSLRKWQERINIVSLLIKQQFKNPLKKVNLEGVKIIVTSNQSIKSREDIKIIMNNNFHFLEELGGKITYDE